MNISEICDVLQSSCLAPVFADLDNAEIEELETATKLTLQLKGLPSQKEPSSIRVFQAPDRFVFTLRNIAQTKTGEGVARIGHVNHILSIPKLCWDPEDGEVYAEWTVLIENESDLPPVILEKVLAHLLQVFMGERQHFLGVELSGLVEKGLLGKDQAAAMLETIRKEYETTFGAPVHDALEDG